MVSVPSPIANHVANQRSSHRQGHAPILRINTLPDFHKYFSPKFQLPPWKHFAAVLSMARPKHLRLLSYPPLYLSSKSALAAMDY